MADMPPEDNPNSRILWGDEIKIRSEPEQASKSKRWLIPSVTLGACSILGIFAWGYYSDNLKSQQVNFEKKRPGNVDKSSAITGNLSAPRSNENILVSPPVLKNTAGQNDDNATANPLAALIVDDAKTIEDAKKTEPIQVETPPELASLAKVENQKTGEPNRAKRAGKSIANLQPKRSNKQIAHVDKKTHGKAKPASQLALAHSSRTHATKSPAIKKMPQNDVATADPDVELITAIIEHGSRQSEHQSLHPNKKGKPPVLKAKRETADAETKSQAADQSVVP